MEVMGEEDSKYIGYNEYGMLDEVFDRAMKEGIIKDRGSRGGISQPHPLNRQQQIRDALARDNRFSYMLIRCTTGKREQLVREFYLTEENYE